MASGVFTVEVERLLRAPLSSVWDAVKDFGQHHRFNPFIEHSRITNDIPTGEGAEREVRLYDGTVMLQRVVDYQPGESMVIEVIETTHWIRHHLIEVWVQEADSEASCILACRISFRPPWGPLGLPVGWVYKKVLQSRYNHVLRGLEAFARAQATGRESRRIVP
jgi:uncharacterized protein YndB with AHSA1/START domain